MVPFIAFDPPLQKLQCVSLRKTLVSDLGQKCCFCPWDIRGGGIPCCNAMPQFQWNQRFLDRSLSLHSIRVSACILWWVENRFLEPCRDPSYNWFWVLKPNQFSGLRISKFEKVYLGMGNVIKIPIGSQGPFYYFWPPIAKIAMCLTKENPSFWYRINMMITTMIHKGCGKPYI